VGFVDDEQDVAALAGQVVEGGAELREETHKAESRFHLESQEDFAVEGGDAQVGIGEIDDGIEIVVEGLGKGADGGRFTGADVAGEEGGQALLEGKGQAALGLAMATGSVKVLAVDRFGEGGGGQAEKVTQCGHLGFTPCLWEMRAG